MDGDRRIRNEYYSLTPSIWKRISFTLKVTAYPHISLHWPQTKTITFRPFAKSLWRFLSLTYMFASKPTLTPNVHHILLLSLTCYLSFCSLERLGYVLLFAVTSWKREREMTIYALMHTNVARKHQIHASSF